MKKISRDNKIIIALGLLIITIGVICNEWTLALLFNYSDPIDLPILRIIIWSFNILFISAGFLLIKLRNRIKLQNIMISLVTLILCFVMIETAYRVFDPFPYFSFWERSDTERILSQYNEVLGWEGSPGARERLVTDCANILVQNNRLGFRDIDHKKETNGRGSIVFLGDSFTWGYGVDFNEMFVNILREKLQDYEIFNLAHRGYGTDQALLTFKQWDYKDPVKLVILMFCENDFNDNGSVFRYKTPKSKYKLDNGTLTLTNIPVPRDENWDMDRDAKKGPFCLKERLVHSGHLVFKSHFIHDLYYRSLSLLEIPSDSESEQDKKEKYILTKYIIKELRDEVAGRGANLIVIAIPSKKQFMKDNNYIPYQLKVKRICQDLNIDYFGLAPYFKSSFFRAHYRTDMHWNKFGNKVAARAIYSYLAQIL